MVCSLTYFFISIVLSHRECYSLSNRICASLSTLDANRQAAGQLLRHGPVLHAGGSILLHDNLCPVRLRCHTHVTVRERVEECGEEGSARRPEESHQEAERGGEPGIVEWRTQAHLQDARRASRQGGQELDSMRYVRVESSTMLKSSASRVCTIAKKSERMEAWICIIRSTSKHPGNSRLIG